jgi:long-chain acyl-CoA synthetase
MEAQTPLASEISTGSKTIADLTAAAAAKFGDRPAIRYKQGEEWVQRTYAELGEMVSEVARGFIALGIEHGDRVCILANTRPEWTLADLGLASIGAVVVPIYQTNSPEECEWVAGNSEARGIVVENAEQMAKITKVRDRLPKLEFIIVMDPSPETEGAIPFDDLRARGGEVDEKTLADRTAAVTPEDTLTIIYTSGTTGPPKGCVLSHGNYRAILDSIERTGTVNDDDLTYLFLPLAHSFALLIQLLVLDVGSELAYFGGDTKAIIGELVEVKPTVLPSVPRIFEKLYTLATAAVEKAPPEDQERFHAAIKLGLKVRELEDAGKEIPPELQEQYKAADERLFSNVRNLLGGRVRNAVTGAAPIAPEILEFFYACGVPVMEGYGMTETATAATISTPEAHKFGSVGRALPGTEIKIADDGEVLLRGPNIFQGYYRNPEATEETLADGWLHTGDLGSVDEDGFLRITGRKKDIIITAGGKNITPANLENDLKQNRWISQAVMIGDRRPYPVALITLDEEEIPKFAEEHGLPTDIPSLSKHPKVRELIQGVVDKVNESYAQVEKIKKFVILDHDLSQETGELTPTLKVKRNVVHEKYADVIDQLYAE